MEYFADNRKLFVRHYESNQILEVFEFKHKTTAKITAQKLNKQLREEMTAIEAEDSNDELTEIQERILLLSGKMYFDRGARLFTTYPDLYPLQEIQSLARKGYVEMHKDPRWASSVNLWCHTLKAIVWIKSKLNENHE